MGRNGSVVGNSWWSSKQSPEGSGGSFTSLHPFQRFLLQGSLVSSNTNKCLCAEGDIHRTEPGEFSKLRGGYYSYSQISETILGTTQRSAVSGKFSKCKVTAWVVGVGHQAWLTTPAERWGPLPCFKALSIHKSKHMHK